MTDKEKWNAACDAMFQHVSKPIDSETRAHLRDEGCCHDYEQLKEHILIYVHNRRK